MNFLDAGLYSTSCNEDYADAEYALNIFMRHHPKAFVTIGKTNEVCGPCQLTSEREERTDSHVD